MRANAPRQIVVEEESGCPSSLNPRVIQPAEGRERCAAAGPLKDDRKGRERLLQVGGAEQGVQAGVLAVAADGRGPGPAEELPCLGGLAQLRGGDRGGQQQRTVGRGLFRW